MADSAAAGATENTANVTIQASLDMTDPPPGGLYRRLIGGGQYRARALSTRIRACRGGRRWARDLLPHHFRYNPQTAMRALIVANRNNHERIPACTFQCRSRARS